MNKVERQRACLVCVERDSVLCIELEDPTTRKRFWSVPGGEIEPGESADEAALRETLEETGYHTRVMSEAMVTHYDFRWNGKIYACTTHWFRGALDNAVPREVRDESYIVHAGWLPFARLRTLLSPHPAIRDAVLTAADFPHQEDI